MCMCICMKVYIYVHVYVYIIKMIITKIRKLNWNMYVCTGIWWEVRKDSWSESEKECEWMVFGSNILYMST